MQVKNDMSLNSYEISVYNYLPSRQKQNGKNNSNSHYASQVQVLSK